jgi:uncharacterized protein (TIGR03643 family)
MEINTELTEEHISRIIEMAWEDRTPFDAIKAQYGLKEQEVKELMRANMKLSSYKMWRKRMYARETKHKALRSVDVTRFRAKWQR